MAGKAKLHALLSASAASGVCGLAYEVVYARALGTYFGHMYYVAASVMAVFLLSLALGSLFAHRFRGSLAAVEAALGVYAFAAAWLFERGFDGPLADLVPPPDAPALTVAAVAGFLLAPAFLSGFSVPLFSMRVRDARRRGEGGFAHVYVAYNAAAAACVLALEFGLVRQFGVADTLRLLGGLNFAVALAVWLAGDSGRRERPGGGVGVRLAAAVFAAGAASAIYQMSLLEFANEAFGPFNENVAVVLAVALFGLALGTVAAKRFAWPLRGVLVASAICAAGSYVTSGAVLWVWGTLAPLEWAPLPALKAALVFALSVAPFMAFGAVVPAAVGQGEESDPAPGRILCFSALGNAVGFLAAALVLRETVPDAWMGAAVGVLAVAASALVGPLGLRSAAAFAGAALVAVLVWPSERLALGYQALSDTRSVGATLGRVAEIETYAALTSELSVLRHGDGTMSFVLNGNSGVGVSRGGLDLQETLVGLAPALYAASPDSAIVLGMGTGVSASAARETFRDVTVVDSSPLLAETLPLFSQGNMRLGSDPRFSPMVQDGIVAVAGADRKWDAIVTTVSSPAYFSASKLYTRDFFEMAESRLKDGGVYVTWLDGTLGARARDILVRTLDSAFGRCRYHALASSYLMAVCGPGADSLKRKAADVASPALDRLLGRTGVEPSVRRVLELTEVSPSTLRPSSAGPVNTLDRPVLEFALSSGGQDRGAWDDVRGELRRRWTEGPDRRQACLASLSLSGAPYCLRALDRDPCEPLPDRFVRSLMSLVRKGAVDSSLREIVRALAARGLHEEVVRAVEFGLGGKARSMRERVVLREFAVRAAWAGNLPDPVKKRALSAYVAADGVSTDNISLLAGADDGTLSFQTGNGFSDRLGGSRCD